VEQEVDALYVWLKTKTPRKKLASQSRENFRDQSENHRMQENVKALDKAAIELAKKQVCISELTLLTQSNWKTTGIKEKALANLDEQLKEMLRDLGSAE